MEIIIGKNAGFCYGVKRAVDGAKSEVNKEKNIYCLGELVHNKQVVESLEKQGLKTIENVDEIKSKNTKVIIRAHGVKKEVYEKLKENIVIDYTCPNVLKIHKIVEKYSNDGYYIFVVGTKAHPETIGTISYCKEYFPIETIDEVQQGINACIKSKKEKALLIVQTTFSLAKFLEIKEKIEKEFKEKYSLVVKNTICNATEIRQKETEELSKKCDLMIIIGGKNSSNTRKLYEISKKNLESTICIETIKDIDKEILKNIENKTVGIMAGASTPTESIEEVVKMLNESNFKTKLKGYQEIVNNNLDKYLDKNNCPEKILNESIEYSLMAGGKRLRPILVLATYSLFAEDLEKCMPFAMAVEVLHNFSLIHDDLPGIDDDDYRHGKLTNHKKFNEATAILAGDALLNKAYMVLHSQLKEKENLEEKIKIVNEFSSAVDRLIAGEYLDTELEGKSISEDMLKYIHKNKTGELLKLSVRMGAISAKANAEDLEKLTAYAENIGLAFQIKDDILSEEGSFEETGKPVGNDKEKGKCTYVSKFGLDGAKEKLKEVTNEAIKYLETYGEKAQFLKDLALYIENRNK